MIKSDMELSDRQVFRTGVLENVALAMMLAPYVAVKFAGKFHFFAMGFGMVLFVLYGLFIYFISDRAHGGYEEALIYEHGILGKLAGWLYFLRFHLKAAIYVLFLSDVICTYMLVNVNYFVVVISFLLICYYGSSKTVVGRGRMMELLFLWLVVPLILMAVFSANSVEIIDNENFVIPAMKSTGLGNWVNILFGGYGVFLLMQSVELLLFTSCYAKSNSRSNTLKIVIWIGISVFMAYIFIMGILGRGWIATDPKASFNVMEAASFPGEAINRLDYLVLAFLMIGMFATVSGFLFCGRRLLACEMTSDYGRGWQTTLSVVTTVAMLTLWCTDKLGKTLFVYLFFADLPIGLILPLIVLLPKKLEK